MATTTSSELYDPEVWADLAHARFLGQVVVAGASGATVESGELQGVPGSTVSFPRWMALGELDTLSENVAMVPEAMGQEASEAKVLEAGKAVEITDTADLVGLGNAQDEAIRQFGTLAARKVDADLISAALGTVADGVVGTDGTAVRDSAPLSDTLTGGLTWDNLVDALEEFGDDFEPDEYAGLFIRASERSSIWKDEQFIRASELGSGGDGSVVGRGFIGQVAGLPVYVTNRLPVGQAAIIRRGALGLLYKRRPIVETGRDILARTSIVATNVHYAVKRLDDSGVLALTVA